MKLLLIFLVLSFCAPAFSQSLEFSGTTWAFSGVGCRNPSLDPDTHVSKSPKVADLTASIIYFVDDSNANMNVTIQGREESRSGTYRVNGDEVSFAGGQMIAYIRGGRLIIIGNRVEAEVCCSIGYWHGWREAKRKYEEKGTIETYIGPENKEHLARTDEDFVKETWEDVLQRFGYDEEWLADNKEEMRELGNKCLKERPFVYVLGRVN